MLLSFKLRKGVMSHPFRGYPKGVEITSDDVLFTIAKNADPKKSTTAATFQNFVASAPDPYTVEIRLRQRVPTQERLSPTSVPDASSRARRMRRSANGASRPGPSAQAPSCCPTTSPARR